MRGDEEKEEQTTNNSKVSFHSGLRDACLMTDVFFVVVSFASGELV